MKTLFVFLSLLFLIILIPHSAFAQRGGGGGGTTGTRQMLSASIMALTSSTKQGGQGPSGSTVLSQSEYIYAWPSFGLGFFFMYDMQGSTEKDSAYGPKLEYYFFDTFFIELGYAMTVKRAYTDRTVAEQTGTGMHYGFGTRFKLGQGGGQGPGWFFQASYKIRTQTLKKQDGIDLTEPIVQTDGYPLIGLGYQF